MERLPMWYDGNQAICENEECSLSRCPFADPVCEQTQSIIDRLAAYEETGLEPEDFKRAFTEDVLLKLTGQLLGVAPDRLRELAQADREGRCVVLPCKIGSPVYSHARRLDGTDYVKETEFWWSDIPQMSKPVFLTRKEAEAALRREQDG